MLVVGLDVWKQGWVAVGVRSHEVAFVASYPSVGDCVAGVGDVDAIGIDIPIVLPERPPRRADQVARAAVGPRRSSLFNAPPLSVLTQPTYQEALHTSREQFGVGLSAQSYALRKRILDARSVALDDPRCIEVFPELSFATMAGEVLHHAKRTWNGQMQRRRLLGEQGLWLPDELEGAVGSVPVDDLLDAAAAAWTADRYAQGVAVPIPGDASASEAVIWS